MWADRVLRTLCLLRTRVVWLQTEQRYRELTDLGLKVKVIAVGNKGKQYFKRRPKFDVVSEWQLLLNLGI